MGARPLLREVIEFQKPNGRTSACFMPEGVPHSMFSRKDNPDTDMYWLEALQAGVVDFIVNGTPMPTSGEVSASEAPWEICRTDKGGHSS